MKLVLTNPKEIKFAASMEALATSLAELYSVFRPYHKYRELEDNQYEIVEEIQKAVYELLGEHVVNAEEYINELYNED